MTERSEGSQCLCQRGQTVQEEYLTMMKALESFKTSEAILKNYTSHIPEELKLQQLCCLPEQQLSRLIFLFLAQIKNARSQHAGLHRSMLQKSGKDKIIIFLKIGSPIH